MTLSALLTIDATLAKHGVHPMTSWWHDQLTTFYDGGYRRFVGRVGRGGTKSHVAAKVAMAETLGHEWHVPPGERHYFAFVSQNKPEAGQRLAQLQHWLTAIGVPHDRRGDAIDLDGLPLGFRVFACQVGAVSGFRAIGFVCDELAKWHSDGVNPAAEVVTSLRAMCVTHPDAIEWFISSAYSKRDYHYQLVEEALAAA